MKSLQSKFILLITSALLTLSVFVGGFSLLNTSKVVENDAVLVVNAVCTEQALQLDNQLSRIEQSVHSIYELAFGALEDASILERMTDREKYTKEFMQRALIIADNTDGAMAVYFRYNPEIADNKGSFYYVKRSNETSFTRERVTNLSKYSEDAPEVAWYYGPVNSQSPCWTSPYYNKEVGAEIISYSIPFYYDGRLIGVVGMDIDFRLFVDVAQDAQVYETGKIYLIDLPSKQVFYNVVGSHNTILCVADVEPDMYTLLMEEESNNSLLDYSHDGIDYRMTYRTVRNKMKCVVYAPSDEINAERNQLLAGIVFLTLGILIMFLIFTGYMTRKIIKPLRELNEAAKKIADGNLDIDINFESSDEIGNLTRSINSMAGELKEYVSEMNTLAYKDGLTGVKNKTFYMEFTNSLKESKGEDYAIVVFDVNNLKTLNDNYGHEQGDALIKAAAKHICHSFAHSPVFRIGGDEFVAILQGNDYIDRKKLLERFASVMGTIRIDMEPYSIVSVAYGMADYGEGNGYDEVFGIADHKMYECKKLMKNGAEPR